MRYFYSTVSLAYKFTDIFRTKTQQKSKLSMRFELYVRRRMNTLSLICALVIVIISCSVIKRMLNNIINYGADVNMYLCTMVMVRCEHLITQTWCKIDAVT
jgi:hypothetical protein